MNLTLQSIPSPLISEIMAESQFDGVVLDTEHGHFNNETLFNCIQVITLSNKKCFVRVTDLNKQLIRMCLDAGVDGLIFSTIETHTQALELIEYSTYPMHGGIRGSALVTENKLGKNTGVSMPNYEKISNAFGLTYKNTHTYSMEDFLNLSGPALYETFMNPEQDIS